MGGVHCDAATYRLQISSLSSYAFHEAIWWLQDNAWNYDKGVLAEILEPIMGKGLIPADLETWKPRRRAIVPAFHRAYLEAMVAMFGACTQETVKKLERAADRPQAGLQDVGGRGARVRMTANDRAFLRNCCLSVAPSCFWTVGGGELLGIMAAVLSTSCNIVRSKERHRQHVHRQGEVVDMEEEFLNLGLDIIGLGVFNYKFGSITTESPVIKASPMFVNAMYYV